MNILDMYGYTPFHIACCLGYLEIVQLLMQDPRVNINTSEKAGMTPFHEACRDGYLEIVQLLIQDPRVNINKIDNL